MPMRFFLCRRSISIANVFPLHEMDEKTLEHFIIFIISLRRYDFILVVS